MNTFFIVAAAVGTVVIVFIVLIQLVEIFRAFYWAIWVTRIMYRKAVSDGKKVPYSEVIKHVWLDFWDQCYFSYNRISSQFYSHGYWPWEEKHDYTKEES